MSNYEPELNDILLDGPADLLEAAEEAEVDLADGEFLEEEPTRRSTDLVRLYLQEIGRVPLLGRDEEVALAQKVQDYMKLLDLRLRLQKELGRDPTLAEWVAKANQYPEWAQLTPEKLQQIQRIGKRAKEHMIKANLRLVVSVAKKYQNRGLELLDLIQEGTLGLERAVEKFDPKKGLPLQHLRLLVDPAGHYPRHCHPKPHHPPARSHHREAEQDQKSPAQAFPGERPYPHH